MERTIFHLGIKATGEDKYYGSIKALIQDNNPETLGIGIHTLYRVKFEEQPYENDKIVIKKGGLITTGSTKKETEIVGETC